MVTNFSTTYLGCPMNQEIDQFPTIYLIGPKN